jgi:hypothetical protein
MFFVFFQQIFHDSRKFLSQDLIPKKAHAYSQTISCYNLQTSKFETLALKLLAPNLFRKCDKFLSQKIY